MFSHAQSGRCQEAQSSCVDDRSASVVPFRPPQQPVATSFAVTQKVFRRSPAGQLQHRCAARKSVARHVRNDFGHEGVPEG
jgi:hypothetical protein